MQTSGTILCVERYNVEVDWNNRKNYGRDLHKALLKAFVLVVEARSSAGRRRHQERVQQRVREDVSVVNKEKEKWNATADWARWWSVTKTRDSGPHVEVWTPVSRHSSHCIRTRGMEFSQGRHFAGKCCSIDKS